MSFFEKFSLPRPSLLVSIIPSATCIGFMIPYARTLPLVFGYMVFTLIYYFLFLLSAFAKENSGHQSRLYISPSTTHTVWILMIALFWLAAFIHGVATLTSGNISDADICLAMLGGLEFILTTHIAYLCGKELRKQNGRWRTDMDVIIESAGNFKQGL